MRFKQLLLSSRGGTTHTLVILSHPLWVGFGTHVWACAKYQIWLMSVYDIVRYYSSAIRTHVRWLRDKPRFGRVWTRTLWTFHRLLLGIGFRRVAFEASRFSTTEMRIHSYRRNNRFRRRSPYLYGSTDTISPGHPVKKNLKIVRRNTT